MSNNAELLKIFGNLSLKEKKSLLNLRPNLRNRPPRYVEQMGKAAAHAANLGNQKRKTRAFLAERRSRAAASHRPAPRPGPASRRPAPRPGPASSHRPATKRKASRSPRHIELEARQNTNNEAPAAAAAAAAVASNNALANAAAAVAARTATRRTITRKLRGETTAERNERHRKENENKAEAKSKKEQEFKLKEQAREEKKRIAALVAKAVAEAKAAKTYPSSRAEQREFRRQVARDHGASEDMIMQMD